jgi:hypothetical protein
VGCFGLLCSADCFFLFPFSFFASTLSLSLCLSLSLFLSSSLAQYTVDRGGKVAQTAGFAFVVVPLGLAAVGAATVAGIIVCSAGGAIFGGFFGAKTFGEHAYAQWEPLLNNPNVGVVARTLATIPAVGSAAAAGAVGAVAGVGWGATIILPFAYLMDQDNG